VPPWFAPAFAPVLALLQRTYHMECQTYSMACGDGLNRPFKIVPFLDGSLPTDAAVCLSICVFLEMYET
jgi:hypothetical protein